MFKNLKIAALALLVAAGLSLTISMTVSAQSLSDLYQNEGTTGTTVNRLAKINTSNQALNAGTSDTGVPTYIVTDAGGGTTGKAALAKIGQALCVFDATNASFASQPIYVVASTTSGDECHAQTTAPAAGVWVDGFLATSSTTSGATSAVEVNGFFMPATVSGITNPNANGLVVCGGTNCSTSSTIAAPTGTVVGTSDAQTLTNKSIAQSEITGRYWSCQSGLGDGLNAVPAGTYLQTFCYNDTGSTVTLSGVKCYIDGGTSSTLNATNGAGTSLLTGAVTCSTAFAAGTQSATTTIASGDFIKFTFVADGTAKQSTWVVTGSY